MSNEAISWSPGVTLEDIEKVVILKAFRHFRGNKTITANALGIAVRTLDNKLEKYESDGRIAKDRDDADRIKRSEFIDRQRGGGAIGNAQAPIPARSNHSASGLPLESIANATAQHAVPVQERPKIQTVSSVKAAESSARKNR